MAIKSILKQAGTGQRGTRPLSTDIFYDSTADALKVINNAGSAVTVVNTTLTNVDSTSFAIQDHTDATKQIAFDASGITAAHTSTLKAPELNGTDTLVVLAATQALTGKTYNKVTVTAPATASTLTIADGKTLTANSTATIAGGDANTLAIAAGKTLTASNTMTLAAGADGQTYTLPTATDNIVGRASTDVLSNKTFSDSVVALGTMSQGANVAAGGAGGSAISSFTKILQKTAIANATATDVFTVTVPNAAHSAFVVVEFAGSLGAGGAIGANEATGAVTYNYAIARTAGVATVVTASSAVGSVTSAVVGAATITVTSDVSSILGAVGAQQTFTIRVTITRGSGSSTNHTCVASATVINANATGVTIA